MSNHYFCTDCEFIKTTMVPGLQVTLIKEFSCPARFNPREGKWIPEDGVNPHECPRNEDFMQLQKQSYARRLR